MRPRRIPWVGKGAETEQGEPCRSQEEDRKCLQNGSEIWNKNDSSDKDRKAL